ncbi:hypothetical protein PoB_003129100 [Plakobranchus ocellatus]|uniref:Uncharacterized protein n=1 Tax=Plakobranchus ocellatus TaxID=259542 RepID=A0AAV4ADR4_9GAST|nr:hypothetical protein PoB_003129100 [Plakobranchus ocellatus]
MKGMKKKDEKEKEEEQKMQKGKDDGREIGEDKKAETALAEKGAGGILNRERALGSAGTLLSWVRAPPSTP